jgi:phosphatidylethanolamine/phosphatidyl-N-methylethanolamine N-methyltransferase
MAVDRRPPSLGAQPSQPADEEAPSRRLEFFKGFLTRPFEVGSVTPSSQILVRQLLRSGVVEQARVVVELGPGTGVVTRGILEALPAAGRLVAIEAHPDFVQLLGRTLSDSRLVVHQGRAEGLEEALASAGESHADTVFSGIPFSTLRPEEAQRTLEAIRRALRPGGRFVAYQVRSQVRRLATPFFGPAQESLVLRNIPPVRIYTWVKADGG